MDTSLSPATSTAKSKSKLRQTLLRLLILLPSAYLILLAGQPAGLDLPKIANIIANDPGILLQQLINGLAGGSIIAIIALGYTLVYGIIELVNFANGDVFMLGTFVALLALAPFITVNPDGGQTAPWWAALLGFIPAMGFCALLNVGIERFAYRPLRNAPKIVALISAIGMSFVLQNIGLQIASFGKLTQVGPQFSVLGVLGSNNAAPKSFPSILSNDNLLVLIFPPSAKPEAPAQGDAIKAAAPAGESSGDDLQATVDASIQATMDANATLEAQPTPEGEATPEATLAEAATPEANAIAEATAEVGATMEAPTPEAEATTEPGATEEAAATEEPTPDLIATMQAESGGTPIASPEEGAAGQQTPQESAAEEAERTRIRLTIKDVLVIAVATVLMLALRWFVQNTRLGKAMRATAQNRAAAQIMGINIDRIIALTFAISGGLAGAAGMMTGIYNGTAVFTMGFTAGLRSFTAAVLGGIGNITGAALGGILIGVLAAFSDQFLSVRWTNAWVFLILVFVLIFRPTGLLGQEGGEKA